MTPVSPPPALQTQSRRAWGRSQAIPVSVAFAAGILIDDRFPLGTEIWMSAAAMFLLSALLALWKKSPRCVVGMLLLVLCSLGGCAHRRSWQAIGRHPMTARLSETPVPVRLKVRLVESPSYRRQTEREFTPAWKRSGRSSFVAECLSWNGEPLISGRVLVSVRGHLVGPRAGDLVEVLGTIRRPPAPRNPGEFNYRLWMYRNGLLANVFAEHPRQVTVLHRQPLDFRNTLPRLRARLMKTFERNLPHRVEAGIAGALILGDRSHLPYSVKRSFLKSGSFHLLAISGLHIGLIAYLLTRLLGILNFSVKQTAVCTILILALYAFLTGLRPSVLRATVFLIIYLAASVFGRTAHRANTLGLTVLVLLVINPNNLFDSGAQLSFLAVTAILAVSPLLSQYRDVHSLAAQAGRGIDQPLLIRGWIRFRQSFVDGFLIGCAVWIFTFPVAARNFHLFPMWGVPLTLLLIPLITVALVSGLLYLICACLFPVLAPAIAPVLNAVLTSIRWIVETVAVLPGSGWNLPPTPLWWNLGYLLGLIGLLLPSLRPPHLWKLMLGWIGLHFIVTAIPRTADQTTVTVYSVGHGLAVLMEFPDNTRMLYDCGSNDGGLRAARAILGDLREQGITRIDRVYLSHADHDHYSALPDLLDEIDIPLVVTTAAVLDSPESNLGTLRHILRNEGCKLRVVAAGDAETIADQILLEVLHPPAGDESSSDNAASLVLRLQVEEINVLLTGDLEREGLALLLQQAPLESDILLSPHHGSLSANPPLLADSCRPRFVMVSSGYRVKLEQLESIYRQCETLYCTERDGAVRFTISAGEGIQVKTYRESNGR